MENEPVLLEAQETTAEHSFYVAWGRETIKNNISLANDVLRQFLSLNTTLLGGSLVFLDPKLISSAFRWFALTMFFLSFIVCLFGIVPFEGQADIRIPEDIRKHKEKALLWKRRCFWAASILIVAGLAVIAVGIGVK
ncbi:MAG TPA: hypothetical protein VGB77_00560 [Abditibacteriaceae bacterium]